MTKAINNNKFFYFSGATLTQYLLVVKLKCDKQSQTMLVFNRSVLDFISQPKMNHTNLNVVQELILFAIIMLFFNCPVDAAQNSNGALDTNEGVEQEVPMEKDPHFLVWKIISKVFILTVLRATRRLWYPNYSIIGYCYGIYMVITLALWLKICCDNIMEYILINGS